jgi:hypothetical protein
MEVSPAALVYTELVGIFILLLCGRLSAVPGRQSCNRSFYCMAIGPLTAA